MKRNVFMPGDILLPKEKNFEIWSVIACDQFSADKEYWNRVDAATFNKKSTYRMIVPEAFLEGISMEEAAKSRNDEMKKYIDNETFETIENSFVYVEREVTGGKIRRGLVGIIDLDAYDYAPGNKALIRASEKTVVDRLPPRIAVRKNAPLELAHVMMLLDDPGETVIEPLTAKKDQLTKLYDFELMEGGGHIRGYKVSGKDAEDVMAAFSTIDKTLPFVIGDGNHSLAAAKACWEEVKTQGGNENHPSRYAMVELNNVYDDGIEFQAIHRVLFNIDAAALAGKIKEKFTSKSGWHLSFSSQQEKFDFFSDISSIGELIEAVQKFSDEFLADNGGSIDYIHDTDAAENFAKENGNAAIFLPEMDKADLFRSVEDFGVFPKKSFSIGNARDKRYYLECRKIK